MSSITNRWGWRLLFVLGGFLLSIPACSVYLNIFTGTVLQRSASLDGKAQAQIRVDNFAAATDVSHSSVELRSGLNPLWCPVFSYINNGAKVTISWIDSDTLQVDCGDECDRLDVEGLVRRWKNIRIRYSPDLLRHTRWEKGWWGRSPSYTRFRVAEGS